MPDRRPTAAERQARLAAVRAEQRKKERGRAVWIGSIAGVLVLALVGISAWVILDAGRDKAALEAQADADIDGVEVIDGLTFNHVTTTVDYPQSPPAGGDHNAAWLNCGVYTEPVPNENAVHSLEHGAVWITYDPALPAEDVATLQAFADNQSYVLVSPYEGLDSPVAISAWGYQLKVDSVDDERLPVFLQKYLLNPELTEVGAPCSSGVGTPA
ncbi:DUF3105 domain-containing protein [Cellulomonas sp. IC4_254]|uniref:DUF3105 domain-containing protein n=1 Tax=Cellulomonas sp. IC4_254 TaxID=2714040 RepID=UPI0014219452|nr:DUF3105 domain-containing protein [Cellulomonas sp. IC4_254]NHT19240.1 DUF3105 domain-containing protein [Cellulomonas sp. IC4_254]